MNPEVFILTGEDVETEPYHYRTCGLEGIFLLNGFTRVEHDGEEHVSITNTEGLHQAIGRHIVVNRKGLAPKDVRFLRNTMGLTQSDLALKLGTNSQSVARWEKGKCEMPGAAEKLLRVVFLVSLLNDEEMSALRDFITREMDELDQVDELKAGPAQFRLGAHWSDERRLAA